MAAKKKAAAAKKPESAATQAEPEAVMEPEPVVEPEREEVPGWPGVKVETPEEHDARRKAEAVNAGA